MSTDTGATTSIAYSLAPMLSVPQWRASGGVLQVGIRGDGGLPDGRPGRFGGGSAHRLKAPQFWLADESLEHGNFSPESLTRRHSADDLTVPAPDAMFARVSCGRCARSLRGGGSIRMALGPRG